MSQSQVLTGAVSKQHYKLKYMGLRVKLAFGTLIKTSQLNSISSLPIQPSPVGKLQFETLQPPNGRWLYP